MPSLTRKSKIARWGNSLAVRIPRDAAQQMRLKEGSEVSVTVKESSMTIRPARQLTLAQLLHGVTPEKAGGEIDFGSPVGREVW